MRSITDINPDDPVFITLYSGDARGNMPSWTFNRLYEQVLIPFSGKYHITGFALYSKDIIENEALPLLGRPVDYYVENRRLKYVSPIRAKNMKIYPLRTVTFNDMHPLIDRIKDNRYLTIGLYRVVEKPDDRV